MIQIKYTMETHAFNEEKRFEPIDKTCAFCGQRKSEDPNDDFYIPIFKENDRLNVIVYRRVSYSKIDIGLPRCPHCKEIHQKQKKRTWLYAIVVGFFALVVSFLFTQNLFEEFTILMAILIGFIATMVTYMIARVVLEKSMAKQENILPKEAAAMQYEIVKYFIANGWTFTQPTA